MGRQPWGRMPRPLPRATPGRVGGSEDGARSGDGTVSYYSRHLRHDDFRRALLEPVPAAACVPPFEDESRRVRPAGGAAAQCLTCGRVPFLEEGRASDTLARRTVPALRGEGPVRSHHKKSPAEAGFFAVRSLTSRAQRSRGRSVGGAGRAQRRGRLRSRAGSAAGAAGEEASLGFFWQAQLSAPARDSCDKIVSFFIFSFRGDPDGTRYIKRGL